MNKRTPDKNYYSDVKLSEKEKRIILNDLHSRLSKKNKKIFNMKPAFRAAVSVSLSVCIITSALSYSRYSNRHYVPIASGTENGHSVPDVTSFTEISGSDNLKINSEITREKTKESIYIFQSGITDISEKIYNTNNPDSVTEEEINSPPVTELSDYISNYTQLETTLKCEIIPAETTLQFEPVPTETTLQIDYMPTETVLPCESELNDITKKPDDNEHPTLDPSIQTTVPEPPVDIPDFEPSDGEQVLPPIQQIETTKHVTISCECNCADSETTTTTSETESYITCETFYDDCNNKIEDQK